MNALRFYDTTQVPDYDALFGQEPTPEAPPNRRLGP